MEEKITETLTEKIARWESIYTDTVRRHELMNLGFRTCWGEHADEEDKYEAIKHDCALLTEAEYEVDLAKKTLEELKAQREAEE